MTQPDKLMRREARDIWDDLMERIDLSGAYETFIDPKAIEELVNENERLKKSLEELWPLINPKENGYLEPVAYSRIKRARRLLGHFLKRNKDSFTLPTLKEIVNAPDANETIDRMQKEALDHLSKTSEDRK